MMISSTFVGVFSASFPRPYRTALARMPNKIYIASPLCCIIIIIAFISIGGGAMELHAEIIAVLIAAFATGIGSFVLMIFQKHKEIDNRFILLERRLIDKFDKLNTTLLNLNISIRELQIKSRDSKK